MNHVYRLVLNASKGIMVAIAETASGQSKGSRRSRAARKLLTRATALGSIAAAVSALANGALPVGGVVSAGQASVSTAGSVMNVVQTTQRAAINWQSFKIGSNATVNFVQPNASSVILNRVHGNEQSVIAGAINANGQVFLLNSSGVLFTGTARVDVGGLVASTLNVTDADFMAGRNTFTANGSKSSVINLGTINAKEGGYVALLGNQVKNEGVITARLGTAVLAAGDRVSLNFNGDSLVGVSIDQGTLNALVENKQAIRADGGLVVLTAKGLDAVMRTVVNNTGEVRAQTVANREGKIYLLGGMENDRIEVGGTLDASAPNGGNGGFVETSAANVRLVDGRRVTTHATSGRTGTWLIDPNDYTIAASGGDITGMQLGTDLGSNNVVIATASQGTAGGNGDIHVNDAVTWSSAFSLTLRAERNININQNITASGTTGKLILEYGQSASPTGTENYYISRGAAINLASGQNFSTKLGANSTINYTVVNSASDLQAIGNDYSTLASAWAVGANIDLSGVSWTPIGTYDPGGNFLVQFRGKFDGLGHTISNLNISSSSNYVGLFGQTYGARLANIGITNANVVGGGWVGILSGVITQATSVENVYSSGSVSGSGNYIGGLVGRMDSSSGSNSVTRSNSSATVGTQTSTSNYVGGLSGYTLGSTISNSYASGNVYGGRIQI